MRSKYKNNPLYFAKKRKDNPYDFNDNPIKNVFHPEIAKVSILDIIRYSFKIIGISLLPLSIALPMAFIWTLFALYFSHVINKIDISMQTYIGIGLALLGVLIINGREFIRTFLGEKTKIPIGTYMIGLVLILISAILRGYIITKLKDYSNYMTPMEDVFNESAVSSIILVVIYIFYLNMAESLPTLREYMIYIIYFLFIGTGGIYLASVALTYLKEFEVVAMSSLSIIFSILLGYFILGEPVTIYKIIGGALIIFGTVIVLLYKKTDDEDIKKAHIHARN